MSPPWTRRAVLQTLPAVTVLGFAGCSGSESSDTYGVEIRNRLTETDFEATEQLDGPQPVTVQVIVQNVDSDAESSGFEETVEVPTGASRTFDDAFTVSKEASMYSMGAEMEPLVEGGLSSGKTRRDSHSFTPDNTPKRNPIPIIVLNQYAEAEEEGLSPYIYISPG